MSRRDSLRMYIPGRFLHVANRWLLLVVSVRVNSVEAKQVDGIILDQTYMAACVGAAD